MEQKDIDRLCAEILKATNNGSNLPHKVLRKLHDTMTGNWGFKPDELKIIHREVMAGEYPHHKLHGFDALRYDDDGHVFYKGIFIDHPAITWLLSKHSKPWARKLLKWCEEQERQGAEITVKGALFADVQPERLMLPEEKTLTVCVVKPGQPAVREEINNKLEDIQNIVDGEYETMPIDNNTAAIVYNAGKDISLEANRVLHEKQGVPQSYIQGTFFLCGYQTGKGLHSLTPGQVNRYMARFKKPELIFDFGDTIEVLRPKKTGVTYVPPGKSADPKKKGEKDHER